MASEHQSGRGGMRAHIPLIGRLTAFELINLSGLAVGAIFGLFAVLSALNQLQRTLEPGSGGGVQMLYFFFWAPAIPVYGVLSIGSAIGFAVYLRKVRKRIRDKESASHGGTIKR